MDPFEEPVLPAVDLFLFFSASELERRISLSRAVREAGRELRASYMSMR